MLFACYTDKLIKKLVVVTKYGDKISFENVLVNLYHYHENRDKF